MNPNGTQDLIQHAFTGADDGSVLYNNTLLFTPTDFGGRSFTLDLRDVPNTPGIQDRIKLSGVHTFTLNVLGRVIGGTEDCIDVNHSKWCNIFVDEVEPTGRNILTCKGSRGISLTVARQIGHGTETDYDYGNKSDQSKEKTTDCYLSVARSDSNIRVRCLNADAPTLPSRTANSTTWLFPSPHTWYHDTIIAILKLFRVL